MPAAQLRLLAKSSGSLFILAYCTPLFEMVGPLGFEPRTKGFT